MATLLGRGSRAARGRLADVRADTPAATLPQEYLDTVALAAAEARGHRSALAPDDRQILQWVAAKYAGAVEQATPARPTPPALSAPVEQPAHTLAL